MSSINKCKNCGSSDLDVDPARGDTVCTNCGTVLEDSVIVSEIQFEENAHGGTSALGHFVSSDSRGGCQGFGGALRGGLTRESREITLDNCKKNISSICNQLRLNQHCLETSFNLYKMALSRTLTKGRKKVLVCAACVYMTCRLEGTSHLLIDFSELLQINVFELGRTYLHLSHTLCISIPAMDPCLYVLRYANQLEFGPQTHEVTMTALRILQRMKKDMLHSGRRPNSLIGASLLMAARWHDFNRDVFAIVKVVNTTESTLKKRLIEFGDTPSSFLTLEEFMNVDLEEEQDPPAFKFVRKKDSERVQKLVEDEDEKSYFVQLRELIEKKLERSQIKRKRKHGIAIDELEDTKSIHPSLDMEPNGLNIDTEMNLADEYVKLNELPTVIKQCLEDETTTYKYEPKEEDKEGIGPTLAMLGMGPNRYDYMSEHEQQQNEQAEIDEFNDLDDIEIDSYLLTEEEVNNKEKIWLCLNDEYLKLQKDKKEREESEGGKKEKKKRKPKINKQTILAKTPGEAIEKMLKEKKISTKINYDVLKSLDIITSNMPDDINEETLLNKTNETQSNKQETNELIKNNTSNKEKPNIIKKIKIEETIKPKDEIKEEKKIDDYDEEDDYMHDEIEKEEDEEEETLSSMLRRNVNEDDYYDDYC